MEILKLHKGEDKTHKMRHQKYRSSTLLFFGNMFIMFEGGFDDSQIV